MKSKYFVFGIILGVLIGYFITIVIDTTSSEGKLNDISFKNNSATQWNWPDSLDALVAASDYHKVIFENSKFRILEVTIQPGQLDPIHTHKDNSIVWVVNTSPIIYKTYGLDMNKILTLIKEDTIIIKPEELNKGMLEKPEPPHSVQNIGKDIFKLYRIEYK